MRKYHRVPLSVFPSLLLFLLVASCPVHAAEGKVVEIRKINGEKVRTPEYRIVGGTPQRPTRRWFQVVVDYLTRPEWVDQLDFEYYVLLKPRKGPVKYKLLKGVVSYVNIPKGRHKSVMYLHPSTVERFGDVVRVAVLVRSGGRLMAIETRPASQQRWWEQLTPESGLLLNRMQTPFGMILYDDYEAIKFDGRR
ncbi:MAG TPA: hypothetical protein EYP62_09305 [Kiritimatiellae bacterium]|nr:hypothetical protein [Kiritimatiellia bacterium]